MYYGCVVVVKCRRAYVFLDYDFLKLLLIDNVPRENNLSWTYMYGGPYMQCTNIFSSAQPTFIQCTNVFLSAQIYFSVHKLIFQCTNVFLSAQIYFSVHKYIFQCTNVFLSAQMYFSVHKCISQCLVTWFSRAFLLLGWDILLLSFALQIDRPSVSWYL